MVHYKIVGIYEYLFLFWLQSAKICQQNAVFLSHSPDKRISTTEIGLYWGKLAAQVNKMCFDTSYTFVELDTHLQVLLQKDLFLFVYLVLSFFSRFTLLGKSKQIKVYSLVGANTCILMGD